MSDRFCLVLFLFFAWQACVIMHANTHAARRRAAAVGCTAQAASLAWPSHTPRMNCAIHASLPQAHWWHPASNTASLASAPLGRAEAARPSAPDSARSHSSAVQQPAGTVGDYPLTLLLQYDVTGGGGAPSPRSCIWPLAGHARWAPIADTRLRCRLRTPGCFGHAYGPASPQTAYPQATVLTGPVLLNACMLAPCTVPDQQRMHARTGAAERRCFMREQRASSLGGGRADPTGRCQLS